MDKEDEVEQSADEERNGNEQNGGYKGKTERGGNDKDPQTKRWRKRIVTIDAQAAN